MFSKHNISEKLLYISTYSDSIALSSVRLIAMNCAIRTDSKVYENEHSSSLNSPDDINLSDVFQVINDVIDPTESIRILGRPF